MKLQDKKKIKQVILHANENKLDLKQMISIVNGESHPVGDDVNFTTILSDSNRIAFSIEEHPHGWCRHISISKNNKPPVMKEAGIILQEFEFDLNVSMTFYEEEFISNDINIISINWIQKIEE